MMILIGRCRIYFCKYGFGSPMYSEQCRSEFGCSWTEVECCNDTVNKASLSKDHFNVYVIVEKHIIHKE